MFLRLGGLFTLAVVVVWLWALFDAITTPGDRMRYLPKLVWVAVIAAFPPLGAIAWFIVGRPRVQAGTPAPRGLGGWTADVWKDATTSQSRPAARTRPTGPDDDPEFLRRLGEKMQRDEPDNGDEKTD